ncbi:MAG: HAMP domain-containing protein [Deltaproteobacteria bacterium]|nr:MAG: HAMP domain-containing protein [Deltaproteobacteria bacterium]
MKKLNISLRTEIVINITILMIAAVGLIGIVVLRMTQAEYPPEVVRRWLLFYIILDSLVLVAFGSFLISRIVVKPLKDMVRATEKIAEGDLEHRVEIPGENEIGMLARSFNRMVERLKENRGLVKKQIQSLEKLNQELKLAQEELIRSEKLAMVGRLAAGVAHEIGNPIGAILGYTGILMKGGVEEKEGQELLSRIEAEINRINKIVRDLLDLARPTTTSMEEVDTKKVVEDCISLLSSQKVLDGIEVDLEFRDGFPSVIADQDRLQQVMVNLILNAVDAMPEGGRLTINAKCKSLLRPAGTRGYEGRMQNAKCKKEIEDEEPLVQPERNLIEIAVSDTGKGISREDLPRVFDPFFTTKEPGKGTGLGLAICQRIIESFGGNIGLESKVGEGTRVRIVLPVGDRELQGVGSKK